MSALVFALAASALVGATVGWPVARLVGGTRAWSLALTPAAAGVACSLAVALSILAESSMWPWLLMIAMGEWAVLLRYRSTASYVRSGWWETSPLVVAAVVAAAPLLLVDVPPVESDARSAWWFHAELFRHGGSIAHAGMAEPAFRFSRPAYPPFVPAAIAAVWHLGGNLDREVALRISQAVVASGVALTAFVVATTLRLNRRGSMFIAALVAATCWGMNAEVGLSGFVDLTWPLFLVPAAVLLLCGRDDRRTIACAAVLVAAAALMKTEAQPAALLLVAIAVVQAGRAWRRLLPVALSAVGSIGLWTLVTVVTDAPAEERGDWSRVVDLLRPGTEPHQRLLDVLSSIAHESGLLVLAGVSGVLAVVLIARWAHIPLGQKGLVSLLMLAGGYVAFLAISLAVSEENLDGYFVSGTYRYVILVRLLVMVDLTIAWVAILRSLQVINARETVTPGTPQAPAQVAS
ncbi:MAG: hypothetical protein JNK12_11670 [Acidimicrobiales bacterium]|nr:hypothetical protein [Acidimicrobiales bacterium]